MRLYAHLGLALASAPCFTHLTLPHRMTRRTVLQKVHRRASSALRQLVNTGFQVLFHSPPGVLFTVPSQYYALSVTKEYLALRSGLRSFLQDFSCPAVLWILSAGIPVSDTGLSPSLAGLPRPFSYRIPMRMTVRTPQHCCRGLGSFPFARRYSENRCFFLFLSLLRCFSSGGSLRMTMDLSYGD